MGLFKSAIQIASLNFHRWKRDYRIWLIFIFIAMSIDLYMSGLTDLCQKIDCSVTIYILTSLFSSSIIGIGAPKTVLHVGMLLLLCDAPFFHSVKPYAVLRSRRKSWWLGEVFYIVGTALIYMLFIVVVSSIFVLPFATWTNEWGTAYEALTFGTETMQSHEVWNLLSYPVPIQSDAVRYLYPDASQLYTFLTGWATFIILGLIVYSVSLVKKNIVWGMSIAGIFIFAEPVIMQYNMYGKSWMQAFSPVCWSTVQNLTVIGENRFLTMSYVVSMYIVLIIALLIISWKLCKKKMIDLR